MKESNKEKSERETIPVGIINLVSEKLLPERIKSVVWNKRIDIIAISCGRYYEVHRIGYKHEEIFKKEEKFEILDFVFLSGDENLKNFNNSSENSEKTSSKNNGGNLGPR
jgi:hypothetical protein